jgi:hypothetical protein
MATYGPWIAEAVQAYFTAATVKAMLVNDTYVPNPDESALPTAYQISGGGYVAGGIDVTSQIAAAYNTTSNRVEVTVGGTVDFGTITATGVGGIVFYVVGGKPLIADIFGSTSPNGTASFVYTASSSGVMWVVL